VTEEGEERRDKQPRVNRPPLLEHDQAAEERPDEVEREADCETCRRPPSRRPRAPRAGAGARGSPRDSWPR
jgi:hypothetical protein